MTSPPAALSLETPACWSFSPSFHLPPSALKSLSSLVHLSLPTFSSSPFFQHPPYSPFTVPPFSLSLPLAPSLYVSRSLCRYFPCWCCPLRAGDCLWVRAEEKSGADYCNAEQPNNITALQQTLCLHMCLYVQFMYIYKWTLFTRAYLYLYVESVHTFAALIYWCKCLWVCVCGARVFASDDQLNHNYLSWPNTKACAAMHHDF